MPKTTSRPKSVPEKAIYEKASQTWRLGSPEEGRLQIWHPCDLRILDASFRDGKLHGSLRFKMIGEFAEYKTNHFDFCTGLIKEFGLPDGDDLSELKAEFADGQLVAARFVLFMDAENEQERLSATFRDGQLETLRWAISGGATTIFSHGGVVIDRKAMKVPKPWPASIEVGLVKGKVKTRRYLDKQGKEIAPVAPPVKVADWGQKTTPAELDGYITSSRFAQDIAAFFPDEKRDETDEDARRAPKVFARLPEALRPAALAFDKIVKKKFPALTRSSLSGYGFDCVKNELSDATDARWFGLSYTMDGDLQLLDLDTGRVLEWVHDYQPFEDDAIFPSLDAYAFAIVRVELAAKKQIPKMELAPLFKRLGFEWATKLV